MQAPKKTAPVREALRQKSASSIEPQPPAAIDTHAVDEGRKPVVARRTDAAALKAKAVSLYSIPATGLAVTPALDSGFKFSALPSDADFSSLHVEWLLDQAMSLLERCATVKLQHSQLQKDKWDLQLELDRFIRLDALRERERKAGRDTLPYERAAMDSAAENSLEVSHKKAEERLGGLTDDLLSTGFNKRMAAKEVSAWLSAFPLKDNDLRGDNASYTFDGSSKTKPDHLFEAARAEADEAAWEQLAEVMAQRFTAMGYSDAGKFRKESLIKQMNWAMADIGFRADREQVDRDAVWEKIYQAQSAGGLFNYSERIPPLERRFVADLREALARLTAAARGLKDVYDYSTPLPVEGVPGYLDDVIAWTRIAQDRTAQIAQLSQTYVLALSLKDLTKAQWEPGRTAAEWTFDVSDDLFKGQANVRLRGIGLTVVGEPPPVDPVPPKGKAAAPPAPPKPRGYWTARVSLPASAQVRYASGTARDLDQKALPSIQVGMVTDRDSAGPEIVEAGALQNASPIGKQWKVTLSPKSTDDTLTPSLRDVQLYLQVSVRGIRTT